MIERHTIKFVPAVSQKDLKKALHESGETPASLPDLSKMKAQIEIVGEFTDFKEVMRLIEQLSGKRTQKI
jgi:hypothetical protein